jgi:FtsP/CotA-like multicopper oxidase with cupredoxin domain
MRLRQKIAKIGPGFFKLYAAVLILTVSLVAVGRAQSPSTNVCAPNQPLITIPTLRRNDKGELKAVIRLRDGTRTLWGSRGSTRCIPQTLRFFSGHELGKPEDPLFSGSTPIPGPTLRARIGDLVEITFLNQVNPQDFAGSLDQANYQSNNTTGCDQVVGTVNGQSQLIYPVVPPSAGPPPDDVMPNCLHGSSTANLHFHGTHTTPSTTGDNVLLFIRPALRNKQGPMPDDNFVNQQFAAIFRACEEKGTATRWDDIPLAWRNKQEELIKLYDQSAPYRGQGATPGHLALPPSMQLWPVNEHEIKKGLWPQYSIGAYPYCFRLPVYKEANGKPSGVKMGQSPGTHWYHAHKHGSTALNVANGMVGAFIIEGQYDVDLHNTYSKNLTEQVLVLQQLSTNPFPLVDPTHAKKGPGAARPQFSVNGGLNPVIKMRPGEVQLWRIVNAAYRDALELQSFSPAGGEIPCSQTGSSGLVIPCVGWRQIAQDGVQFTFTNYNRVGKLNQPLNLAPANRADLLVKAPESKGIYTLTALAYEGKIQLANQAKKTDYTFPLLTVEVAGDRIVPSMDFITEEAKFPVFPRFLADIPDSEIRYRRTLVFGQFHNLIDGKTFDSNHVDQAMLLNTAEEWTIYNQANDKAHPFHIHINPFQITALFQPNSEESSKAQIPDPKDPSKLIPNHCYADPLNPETWKPCHPLTGPFVWWDTFAIPTARNDNLDPSVCTTVSACPAAIQQYTTCSDNKCTVNIAGYFKMRSRFVDYTGQYVVHCHILIHEDRGMMQLVEVIPDTTDYVHD